MPELPILTPEDVAGRVATINGMRDDDEAAHEKEDSLHRAVLAAIAEGVPDARGLAAAALRTQQIDFQRWYA